jgi:hypothetical protein
MDRNFTRIENVSDHSEPVISQYENITRRVAFGREDLARTYHRTKDLIITYKLLRITQYDESDEVRRLTICNLWRVERLPDLSIRTLEFDLDTGMWNEVSSLKFWPEVPFYPVNRTHSLDWWRDIVRGAIWKALIAAGYYDLPDQPIGNKAIPTTADGKVGMSRGKFANLVIKQYLGQRGTYDYERSEYRWSPSRLDPKSMESGCRALRAAFFQHILDRDVLSAMLVINYKKASFVDYLRYVSYRPALLKVATEHRNLLPLLPTINPKQWGRDDLFSRKLWVKDGRKFTALDRRPIRLGDDDKVFQSNDILAYPSIPCQSFEYRSAWRWLSRASSVIVREWAGMGNTIIVNLAEARVSDKAPVYAYVQIVRKARRLERYGISPVIQRLLRVFLKHCATRWKEKGYADVRVWLRDSNQANLSNMLDYLDAEGFERSMPDKNSTWNSLLRRSDDWHRRIAIEAMERSSVYRERLSWSSLLPKTCIGKIVFTPLCDERSLVIEGYEMNHCVSQYAEPCHIGHYRVFSVKTEYGTRSTLGIEIRRRKAVLDQHLGRFNDPITLEERRAGKKIVSAYQQALSNEQL